MQPEIDRAWVELRLRVGAGGIHIDAVSSTGERVVSSSSDQFVVIDPANEVLPASLQTGYVSEDLSPLIEATAEPLEGAYREAGIGAGLPIFVRPPAGLSGLRWDVALEDLLQTVQTNVALRPILLGPDPIPTEPARLSLPLHVVVVGADALTTASRIQTGSSWSRRDGLLRLEVELDPTRLSDRFDEDGIDVLICSASTAAAIGPQVTVQVITPDDTTPGSGGGPGGGPNVLPTPTARTTVILGASTPDPDQVVVGFLEELTHDAPFHDAFAAARQISPGADGVLLSSPEALHDLRLRDLVARTAEVVNAIEIAGLDLGFNNTILSEYTDLMNTVGFDQESDGLFPTAEVLSTIHGELGEALRAATARMQSDQGPVWGYITGTDEPQPSPPLSPQSSIQPTEPPPEDRVRVVNVAMRRHPSMRSETNDPFIVPDAGLGLVADGLYDLLVGIGARSRYSLVEGSQSPIDALVPPNPAGHLLHITLFPGDLECLGPLTHEVFLSTGSFVEPVRFPIRVPSALESVSCRVGIYYQHNLLQSFLLTSGVADDERQTTPRLSIEQDFATTTTWNDLADLGPRRMSIVVNDAGETHRMYVSGEQETAADWALNPDVQAEVAAPLRNILTTAIADNAPPAAESLRRLAKAGEKLANRLDERVGPDREAKRVFRQLGNESDQIIQIVRADAHQAIPWTMLYDWVVPSSADVPVCWGCDRDGGACGHQNGDEVICVRGFWGVRHKIEELVRSVGDQQRTLPIERHGLTIDLAEGVTNSYITQLRTNLDQHATVIPLAAGSTLMSALWKPGRAPVCAVVGHMTNEGKVLSGAADDPIDADTITGHARRHDDLAPPGPLLMLLVCESGAVTPKFVSSVALSLTQAGAAGLVCTETVVRSSHLRDFATVLVRSLGQSAGNDADPFPLASALQRARTAVIETETVAGLAFIAFGPANLRLEVTNEV